MSKHKSYYYKVNHLSSYVYPCNNNVIKNHFLYNEISGNFVSQIDQHASGDWVYRREWIAHLKKADLNTHNKSNVCINANHV